MLITKNTPPMINKPIIVNIMPKDTLNQSELFSILCANLNSLKSLVICKKNSTTLQPNSTT